MNILKAVFIFPVFTYILFEETFINSFKNLILFVKDNCKKGEIKWWQKKD